MTERLISNVSDTARWVAVYRAAESARSDALFRDPLAGKLAGDHGHAIASKAGSAMGSGWPIITRTVLLDGQILRALDQGCDLVLNLAAGLDTRPYRLPLKPGLRWIEADLPALVDEKERLLAGEKPACQLQREKVDLADAAARGPFLARALADAKQALVIAEGLLVYLEPEAVRALAQDLARPNVRTWLLDMSSPRLNAMVHRRMRKELDNAPFKFGPPEGVAFFEQLGWKVEDVQPIFSSAAKLKRLPWFLRLFAMMPAPNPRQPGRAMWSAVVRLGR
jgi:methyltransferase (TIGR00027 family)